MSATPMRDLLVAHLTTALSTAGVPERRIERRRIAEDLFRALPDGRVEVNKRFIPPFAVIDEGGAAQRKTNGVVWAARNVMIDDEPVRRIWRRTQDESFTLEVWLGGAQPVETGRQPAARRAATGMELADSFCSALGRLVERDDVYPGVPASGADPEAEVPDVTVPLPALLTVVSIEAVETPGFKLPYELARVSVRADYGVFTTRNTPCRTAGVSA